MPLQIKKLLYNNIRDNKMGNDKKALIDLLASNSSRTVGKKGTLIDLLSEGKKETGMDIAQRGLESAYQMAGANLIPKQGIGKNLVESAITGSASTIPGGQYATKPFLESGKTRAITGIASGLAVPSMVAGAITAPTVVPPLVGLAGSVIGNKVGQFVTPDHPLVGGTIGSIAGGVGGYALGGKLSGGVTPEQVIRTNTSKAVRPSGSGKTGNQYKKVVRKQSDAVKEIAANKDAYQFTDKYGNTTTRVPKNMEEAIIAIDGVKRKLYNQYSEVARKTGELTDIDMVVIAKNLVKEFSKGKYKNHPSIQRAAFAEAQRLKQMGRMSITDAEGSVQVYNSGLENYYKKGVYETGKNADVDAFVSRAMNNSIDKKVNSLQGPGYKDLKARYGNIRLLEKDLVKRAAAEANQAVKGLFDVPDILSSGQIARGIFALKDGNPAMLASGVTTKIISGIAKKLNTASNQISKAFNAADKMVQSGQYKPVNIQQPQVAGLLSAPPQYGQAPVPFGLSGVRPKQIPQTSVGKTFGKGFVAK